MPDPPDTTVVERRLTLMRDLLDQIEALSPVSAQRLRTEPLVRAGLERMLQSCADLAIDINGHLSASVLGRAPATGRASFDHAVEVGAIEQALAARLKPSVGLRNVLVRQYADIDVNVVADSVETFLGAFRAYVRDVARWSLGQA
jgi:uncharacterized protein YutE (UPF0331/DUF86 family)